MSTRKYFSLKIHVCCFSTFMLFASTIVYADDVATAIKEEKAATPDAESNIAEFDPSLLRQEGQSQIDVSRFVYGSNVLPGKYRIDILVNQNMVSHQEVTFKSSEENKNKVVPCLSPDIIKLVNLNNEKLPFAVRKALTEAAACTDLPQLITGATVKFDADRQQLNIDVPQVYLQHTARGNIDPSLWDSGVPALMLGYYMNGYESHYSGMDTSRSFYSSLNAGLNIGKWYFRHNGSYNWDQDMGGRYQSNNTYVQRDIEAVRGHLYLGQYYTSGQMFNTVSYTGAQLATDDRMLPASQRGYAPEIRGVAKTNAKVTVRQSGNILYQTTVPPGAFLIDDLGPTGYGGDLDVTVEEADGTLQQYSIPYSSLAQSLRPGAQQFTATAGKMDDYNTSEKPLFYEVTFMRGITNILTVYTGAQYSQNY
ncbi:TPA: fimbria/pilus outer membrane usher protein, partial [Citrobacter freundii]|nr:fimbria/pilus outer membrane usher protein [Citrobacter freundii]